jgi:hypothetical protein
MYLLNIAAKYVKACVAYLNGEVEIMPIFQYEKGRGKEG